MNDIVKRKGSHVAAMTGMSQQEILFTIELIKDCNPVRAGQACGIAPDEALELSNKKHVKRHVQAILAQRLDEAEVDIDWLLYELRDNHTISRQQGNMNASNKALELIGKMAPVDAFAANKVEHSGEVGLIVQVKKYSDEAVIQGEVLQCDSDEGGRGDPSQGGGASVCFL